MEDIKIEQKDDKRNATYTFAHETHTLGNALRHILLKDENTTFCGYTIPHPMKPEIRLRLQTKTNSHKVLKQGFQNLMEMSEHILKTYDEAEKTFSQQGGEQGKVKKEKMEDESVWLVQKKSTGKLYAQKMFQIYAHTQPKRNRELFSEINVLENIESNYVVRMEEYFREKNMMYVLLEFMDYGCLRGILNELVIQKKEASEDIIAQIAFQSLLGLEVLHDHVIHRDIKPGNILLNSNGEVKIADPGVAGNTKRKRYTPVGTKSYMSPERMYEAEHHPNSDVWGLGLTLLELSLRRFPITEAEDPLQTVEMLVKVGKGEHLIEERKEHSVEFRDFINKMLERDPTKRPCATKMLQHSFLKNMKKEEQEISLKDWLGELMESKKKRESVDVDDDDQERI